MCTKESPEVGQKTYDVVLTPKVSSDHVKWWEQPRIKFPVRDRKRTVSRQLAWQEFGYLAKGGKDKIVTEKKNRECELYQIDSGMILLFRLQLHLINPIRKMARFGYKYQSYLILYAKQHISQENREPSQLTLSVLSFPKSAQYPLVPLRTPATP